MWESKLLMLFCGWMVLLICQIVFLCIPTTWSERGSFGDLNGFIATAIATICAFLVYLEQIKANKQNENELIKREFFEEIKAYNVFKDHLEYLYEEKNIKGSYVLKTQGMLTLTDPMWYEKMRKLGCYSVLDLLERKGYFELSGAISRISQICESYTQYPSQTWTTLKRFLDRLNQVELLFVYIFWADSGRGLINENYEKYVKSRIKTKELKKYFDEYGNISSYHENIKCICDFLSKDIKDFDS